MVSLVPTAAETDAPLADIESLLTRLTVYYGKLLEREVIAIYRKEKLAPDVIAHLLRPTESKLRDYRGCLRVFVRPQLLGSTRRRLLRARPTD